MWLSVLLLLFSTPAHATDCQSLTATPVVATFSDVAIGQNVYPVRRSQWKDLREELIECGAHEPARHLRLWIVERNVSAWSLLGGQYTVPLTIGFAIGSRVERNKFRTALTSWDSDDDTVEPDQCPNNPEDADGFEDADGCPEADNDQDGLLDAKDRCPIDPGPASTMGCPDRDSDGLSDEDDECPNDPETVNDYLDSDGCPDERPLESTIEDTDDGSNVHPSRYDNLRTVPTRTPYRVPSSYSKRCPNSKPCGNSCIAYGKTCHK